MADAIAPLPGAPISPLPARAAVSPELRRVAEEFESMFLTEMMGPMFESLDTEGLGGGGMGEQMFRPMLVAQYAEAIAHSGGIGLADSILGELTRLQAVEASDGADR